MARQTGEQTSTHITRKLLTVIKSSHRVLQSDMKRSNMHVSGGEDTGYGSGMVVVLQETLFRALVMIASQSQVCGTCVEGKLIRGYQISSVWDSSEQGVKDRGGGVYCESIACRPRSVTMKIDSQNICMRGIEKNLMYVTKLHVWYSSHTFLLITKSFSTSVFFSTSFSYLNDSSKVQSEKDFRERTTTGAGISRDRAILSLKKKKTTLSSQQWDLCFRHLYWLRKFRL